MDIQTLSSQIGGFMDNFKWDENTPLSSRIYPAATAITYLVVIYGLNKFMKDRKPMTLKGVSIVHNFNLIVLSLTMMLGVLEAAYRQAQEQGGFSLLCENKPNAVNGRIGWWIYVFYVSKYYELFDTVILALKKKPLIFLHVFHHMAMVPVTWQWLNDQWLVGSWWCVLVNSFIHTIMYYYYLQTTLGNDCWFKRYITTSQIIQFLTGTAIVSHWFYIRKTENCQGGIAPAIVSYVINTLFIGLFIRFYIKSYSSKKSAPVNRKKVE
ncbi:steroid isomerase [Heterostelium album PN500]|uniref:Elongation of fatty acids protein n=1 Tax=Heterostelium pallidum (strain ATCC 26659 / Pp 5 / PN500) TaxID=670386 RepID=D3B201_HETP5|nr:steroid isomerase [Heterostelium album PN500]EFA85325.1 steroid isomerase [Heterostelium album PN500]|eukprot:XP_020437434.1 steroid isomerase [Heterostelium album PN500]